MYTSDAVQATHKEAALSLLGAYLHQHRGTGQAARLAALASGNSVRAISPRGMQPLCQPIHRLQGATSHPSVDQTAAPVISSVSVLPPPVPVPSPPLPSPLPQQNININNNTAPPLPSPPLPSPLITQQIPPVLSSHALPHPSVGQLGAQPAAQVTQPTGQAAPAAFVSSGGMPSARAVMPPLPSPVAIRKAVPEPPQASVTVLDPSMPDSGGDIAMNGSDAFAAGLASVETVEQQPSSAAPVPVRHTTVSAVVTTATTLHSLIAKKADKLSALLAHHRPNGPLNRRLQEPMRRKAQWDSLLVEVMWGSAEVTGERAWKLSVAAALARECAKVVLEKQLLGLSSTNSGIKPNKAISAMGRDGHGDDLAKVPLLHRLAMLIGGIGSKKDKVVHANGALAVSNAVACLEAASTGLAALCNVQFPVWSIVQRAAFTCLAVYGRLPSPSAPTAHSALVTLASLKPQNWAPAVQGNDARLVDILSEGTMCADFAACVSSASSLFLRCVTTAQSWDAGSSHGGAPQRRILRPILLRDAQLTLAQAMLVAAVSRSTIVVPSGDKQNGVGKVLAAAHAIAAHSIHVAAAKAAGGRFKQSGLHAIVVTTSDRLCTWLGAFREVDTMQNLCFALGTSAKAAGLDVRVDVLASTGVVKTAIGTGSQSPALHVSLVLVEELDVGTDPVVSGRALLKRVLQHQKAPADAVVTCTFDLRSTPFIAPLDYGNSVWVACAGFLGELRAFSANASALFFCPHEPTSMPASLVSCLVGNEMTGLDSESRKLAAGLLYIPVDNIIQTPMSTPTTALDGLIFTQAGSVGALDEAVAISFPFIHARLERRVYCPYSWTQSRVLAGLAVLVEDACLTAPATETSRFLLASAIGIGRIHAAGLVQSEPVGPLRYRLLEAGANFSSVLRQTGRASALKNFASRTPSANTAEEEIKASFAGLTCASTAISTVATHLHNVTTENKLTRYLCALHYASMHPHVLEAVNLDPEVADFDESLDLMTLFFDSKIFREKAPSTVTTHSIAHVWHGMLSDRSRAPIVRSVAAFEIPSSANLTAGAELDFRCAAPWSGARVRSRVFVSTSYIAHCMVINANRLPILSSTFASPLLEDIYAPSVSSCVLDESASASVYGLYGSRSDIPKTKRKVAAAAPKHQLLSDLSSYYGGSASASPLPLAARYNVTGPIVNVSFMTRLSPKLAAVVACVKEAAALGKRVCLIVHSNANAILLSYLLASLRLPYHMYGPTASSGAPHGSFGILNLHIPTSMMSLVQEAYERDQLSSALVGMLARHVLSSFTPYGLGNSELATFNTFVEVDAPPIAPTTRHTLGIRAIVAKAVTCALLSWSCETKPVHILQLSLAHSSEDADFLRAVCANHGVVASAEAMLTSSADVNTVREIVDDKSKPNAMGEWQSRVVDTILKFVSQHVEETNNSQGNNPLPISMLAHYRNRNKRSGVSSDRIASAILSAATYRVNPNEAHAIRAQKRTWDQSYEHPHTIVDGALRIPGIGLAAVSSGYATSFLPLGIGTGRQLEARGALIAAAHAVQSMKGRRRILESAVSSIGVLRHHQDLGGLHFSHVYAPAHPETRVLSAPPATPSEPAVAWIARTTVSFLDRATPASSHIREKSLPAPTIPKAHVRQHGAARGEVSIPSTTYGLGANLISRPAAATLRSADNVASLSDQNSYVDAALQLAHRARGPKAVQHAVHAVQQGLLPQTVMTASTSAETNAPQPYGEYSQDFLLHVQHLAAEVQTQDGQAGGTGSVLLKSAARAEGATPAYLSSRATAAKLIDIDLFRFFPALASSLTGLSISGGREEVFSTIVGSSTAAALHTPSSVLTSASDTTDAIVKARHIISGTLVVSSDGATANGNIAPDDPTCLWECVLQPARLTQLLAARPTGIQNRKRSRKVFEQSHSFSDGSSVAGVSGALAYLTLAQQGRLPVAQALRVAQAALRGVDDGHISASLQPATTGGHSSDWTVMEDLMLLRAVAEFGQNWDLVREVLRSASLPLPHELHHPGYSALPSAASSNAAQLGIGQRFGPTAALATAARSRPFRSARNCCDRFKKIFSPSHHQLQLSYMLSGVPKSSASAIATALGIGSYSANAALAIGIPPTSFGPHAGLHVVEKNDKSDKTPLRIVLDQITVPPSLRRFRQPMATVGLYHVRPRISRSETAFHVGPICPDDFVRHQVMPAVAPKAKTLSRLGGVLHECKKNRPHVLVPSPVNADPNLPIPSEHPSFYSTTASAIERLAVDSSDETMRAVMLRAPSQLVRKIPFYRGLSSCLPFLYDRAASDPSFESAAVPFSPFSYAHAPVAGPFKKTSPYIASLKNKEKERQLQQQHLQQQQQQQQQHLPLVNPASAPASQTLTHIASSAISSDPAVSSAAGGTTVPSPVPSSADAAAAIIKRLMSSSQIHKLGIPSDQLESVLLAVIDNATAMQIAAVAAQKDITSEQKDIQVQQIVTRRVIELNT